MKKTLTNLLTFIILTCLVVGCLNTTGNIIGNVTDTDSTPIEGATITLNPGDCPRMDH